MTRAQRIENALRKLVSDRHGHPAECACPWCEARAALAAAPEQAGPSREELEAELRRMGLAEQVDLARVQLGASPIRAAPEQAGEFAPRGLVAQYKLTAAEAACAELWAYIASLRAPIGLLASYQPTMDEMLAMRGELGDLIARVKRAADKPVPQNPGAALLGEFARGVEAAAKVCDEYADRMERSYKARADAGTPSYTAECKADAGQTLATKIRTLARAPETQGWRPIETLPPCEAAFVGRYQELGEERLLWQQTAGHWYLWAPEGETPRRNWSLERSGALYDQEPTHWHPLIKPPAPPASAARAKEESDG